MKSGRDSTAADAAAKLVLAQIISELRTMRRAARITQAAMSTHVQRRTPRVNAWETGQANPTLVRLTRVVDRLDQCLVILGPDGKVLLPERPWSLANRTSDSLALWRLAGALKRQRQDLGLSQRDVARIVGTSQSAVSLWELMIEPPSSIRQVIWARKLECSVALRPKDLVLREAIRVLTDEWNTGSHPRLTSSL